MVIRLRNEKTRESLDWMSRFSTDLLVTISPIRTL